MKGTGVNMNFIHEQNKIYLKEKDNIIAEVTFPPINDTVVNINHTYVDPSLRGQGVAGKLMEETMNELRMQNKKAHPTCSYAVKWFQDHPECEDVLSRSI